jgi:predicted HTH domain antitoxin
MTLTITNPDLESMGLTKADVLLEAALGLFASDKLTLWQASRLAKVPHETFLELLVARRIPIHYGHEEAMEDLETSRRLPAP